MNNYITYRGIIHFDPRNKTAKHEDQSSWKKIAMVLLDGEICEYYSWFIERRYGLVLNKSLRNAHISFINDSVHDIKKGTGLINNEDVDFVWNNFKEKYNNKKINIVLNLDVRSDANHWWLNIPEEYRTELHSIRQEIGLGRPFFGLHMSIGYANEKNLEHSVYIRNLCTKFGKEYL
jgi:hypothetical protein